MLCRFINEKSIFYFLNNFTLLKLLLPIFPFYYSVYSWDPYTNLQVFSSIRKTERKVGGETENTY